MSRIDEALRRASQGPLMRRGPVAEVPVRPAEGTTLEDYPNEVRVGSHPERAGAQPDPIVLHTPVRDEPRPLPPSSRLQDEKLVSSPACSHITLEQYRRIAAALHDAQVERGLKTVVVTSAVPREGKTLTAVNLALTLSDSYGRRVLLIDADLRRPSVHEVLGIPNDKGLSELLRSRQRELSPVQVSPLLAVLTSGQPEQNPLAGLSSDRMRDLLEEAASQYEWVILDTPPLAMLSDAQLLSRLTQATVFVVRAGSTPFAVVNKAVEELGRDHIIGTVLNGTDEGAIPAADYYGHYYKQDK